MKISIIIPVYNASLTLKECLEAIFYSNLKNFEVIVVSDNSSDNSVEIAKQFQCKIIELPQNRGPGFARNEGAKTAEGDVLLFLDSDVIIDKEALNPLSDKFSDNEVNVIQGIYSHKPTYNIPTQYQQSFYCYYSWHSSMKYTSSLATNCFAIRRKIFIELNGFNTNIKRATSEDEEFGYMLINKGYKILILRQLNGEHRVSYNFIKLIKRNFAIYTDTTKSYLRNKTYIKKVEQTNYWRVLAGIAIFGLIILSLVGFIFFSSKLLWNIFLSLNIIFLMLHLSFIKFVGRAKGFLKALGVMIVCYIDAFIMLTSLFLGSLSYFFRKKY